MITGALLALVGVLVGRLLPNRRRNPKPVKAICGCEHAIGFHENKTGKCSYVSNKFTGYAAHGESIYSNVRCTCQHYDGPIPVESMFTTPLLPPKEGP